MRKLTTTLFLLALALAPAAVFAGQIYTDANGDGLADVGPILGVPASQNVTVDVYIDSQSFTWTNYQAWVARVGVSYVSHAYVVAPGTNFGIDNFSNPNATGMGGLGFNKHGVVLIGSITFHKDVQGMACVQPILDIADPYGTFSIIATTSDYRLFATASGSCWNDINATEEKSWGAIKGLYQ
jgi:hypothetical protein